MADGIEIKKMKKKKKFELLLATIDQLDDSVLDKMNFDSDIIVCNQNNEVFSKKVYQKNNHEVTWYDFAEKGVGLNRNNALMRSGAEICLLADDDVRYLDGYEETILRNFAENPKADVIIFNIYSDSKKNRFVCDKKMRVNHLNCGRFGAVRIAFRRSKIIKNSISFNILFGGGSMFSAGEDSMFIHDCLFKGLRIIAVPDYILELRDDRKSTWFKGFDRKFFYDLGASYGRHFGVLAYPMACFQLMRKNKLWISELDKKQIKKYIKEGLSEFRKM